MLTAVCIMVAPTPGTELCCLADITHTYLLLQHKRHIILAYLCLSLPQLRLPTLTDHSILHTGMYMLCTTHNKRQQRPGVCMYLPQVMSPYQKRQAELERRRELLREA